MNEALGHLRFLPGYNSYHTRLSDSIREILAVKKC
jgi:hypothetical protein